MKRIITLFSILLFAWTLSAQVKFTQMERSADKWHIPVAKRVVPGLPGYIMTYMELQHLMDSLGLAAAADSIYLSNDTIYLRDGSGFVVIPEQTNPDSIYLIDDTIYLRDGSGEVDLSDYVPYGNVVKDTIQRPGISIGDLEYTTDGTYIEIDGKLFKVMSRQFTDKEIVFDTDNNAVTFENFSTNQNGFYSSNQARLYDANTGALTNTLAGEIKIQRDPAFTLQPDDVILRGEIPDFSPTNEIQFLSTDLGIPGRVTLSGGGSITINVNDADASTSNEGRLGVSAEDANASRITSNTTGANGVRISGSNSILVTEFTSTNGGGINFNVDTSLVSTRYYVDSLFSVVPGGADSTSLTAGFGINVSESPSNTFTISTDTTQIATIHDLTLKQNNITGTTGQTLRFSGTDVLQSNSLLYNDGTNIGIGTVSPTAKLHVDGGILANKIDLGVTTGTGRINLPNTGTTAADGINFGTGANVFRGNTSNALFYESTNGHYFRIGGNNIAVAFSTDFQIQRALIVQSPNIVGSSSTPAITINQSWNTTGVPNAILLNVTNIASAVNSNLMDLRLDNSSQFRVGRYGSVTAQGAFETIGIQGYRFNNSSQIIAPSDGVITFRNTAQNNFNRLQFGGTTNLFPSIKRNGTNLQARLADDSANTDVEVLDEAYGIGWDGSIEVPTKNAVYDIVQTLGTSSDSTTIAAGTGISVSESPANTWTVTNTAPDQTVSIGQSGIVSVTGTYPNFTVSATEVDGSVTNELQTISTSGAAGNITLSNGGGTLNLNVDDADASTTNETITAVTSMGLLSGGNTIVITEAGTSRTGVIPPMVGATAGVAGVQGVVPAPAAGNQNKFLRGDGTWQDAGTSLSGTTGYIPYFNSSTTLAPSAVSFRSDAIFGIGFGLAPASITSDIHLGTGKQLEFDGTATIIDKNNSGGGADEILTRAATGGGLDWRPLGLINGQNILSGDVTIPSGITGTGLAGRVAFWTGASTQSNSNNLFWDNSASRLGIGTLTPSRALDNTGASRLRGAIYDSADSPGTTGQVLTSNGAGAWTWNTPFQNQEVILDDESSYSTTVTGDAVMTYDFSILNTGTFNTNLANGTIEVTVSGNYDLSFNGYFGSNAANNEAIYFQYSTNGGSTWLDFPDAIQGRISPGTSTQSLYSNYMTTGAFLSANTLLRVRRSHSASSTFYHRISYFKVKLIR